MSPLIYGNPLDTPYKYRMNDFAINTVSTGFYQLVGPEFKSIYGLLLHSQIHRLGIIYFRSMFGFDLGYRLFKKWYW